MTVRVSDRDARVLGESTGAELLGHPMASALWLVNALGRAGLSLKAGDLLSLGSFPPVMVPRAGSLFRVTYVGLTHAEPVWVEFTE